MLTAANLLTCLRIVLIVPFVYSLRAGNYRIAIVIFFAASITDFFDGYVARKFDQQSTLGRFIDPLADKILVTAAYVVIAIPHAGLPSIPIWLAAAVIGRDVFILAGSLAVYLTTKFTGFKPSVISKTNTVVELGFILYWMIVNAIEGLAPLRALKPICYGLVAVTVAASGCDYLWKGINIFRARRSAPSDVPLAGP
ncbi:MAG TPA: CDP-alcohol phosphatidyltransferase family protein [Blastocatellia bacterium]|nr:CDP-alcohol phosphatidyltransferase family protein [Blastocatellia bacterium]